jgi:hypothetical protein
MLIALSPPLQLSTLLYGAHLLKRAWGTTKNVVMTAYGGKV